MGLNKPPDKAKLTIEDDFKDDLDIYDAWSELWAKGMVEYTDLRLYLYGEWMTARWLVRNHFHFGNCNTLSLLLYTIMEWSKAYLS
jgi:hypothetical protein